MAFFEKKAHHFHQIDSHLTKVNTLNASYRYKQPQQIQYDFADSTIRTPFLGWRSGRKVRYAMQYTIEGMYSKIGKWSIPYTIDKHACATLDIGETPKGVTRV